MQPAGCNHGPGWRRAKNPGAPPTNAQAALIWLKKLRAISPFGANQSAAAVQSNSGLVVIASQNARSFATRSCDGLPAMIAELMAPIEIPATQSGWRSASANAWYTPA